MPPATLSIGNYRPHSGTKDYPGGQVAMIRACLENEVVCVLNGRDSGKSVALFFLFLEEGRQHKGHYDMAIVSQGHADAERMFKSWRKLLKPIVTEFACKGQHRFLTVQPFGDNDGATVWFWSGETDALDTVRGVRLNRLAVDEAGFVSDKVLPTCSPMLLSRNGKKLFVGTARRGGQGFTWFKREYEQGVNGVDGYKSLSFPSESNPYSKPEKIMRERRALRDPRHPDVPTSEELEEFSGAFITDIGGYFRNLDAAFVLPYKKVSSGWYIGLDEHGEPLQPIPGRPYVIGQDWGGGKTDPSVSSVFDRETHDQVFLRIENAKAPFEEQAERLDKLKRHWNNALIVADERGPGSAYANQRLRIQFEDRLKPVSMTGQGPNAKANYMTRMRHMFDEEEWRFLNVPEQRTEFADFTQTPIGDHGTGFYYEAPRGGHDDTVLAAAFAAVMLQVEPARPRPPPKALAEPLSTAWFEKRKKERALTFRRRGLW